MQALHSSRTPLSSLSHARASQPGGVDSQHEVNINSNCSSHTITLLFSVQQESDRTPGARSHRYTHTLLAQLPLPRCPPTRNPVAPMWKRHAAFNASLRRHHPACQRWFNYRCPALHKTCTTRTSSVRSPPLPPRLDAGLGRDAKLRSRADGGVRGGWQRQ